MISRARAVTSGVLTALAATAGIGLALAAPAAAIPAPSCLTVGTVATSTQCTVAPGESVLVQFKAGNGGHGGFGGPGGLGGRGWTGAAQVAGGLGGSGGTGGIGGAGAAVSGVYTNTTATEVVLTVTLGASGTPGTAGLPGFVGTDAPQAGPGNGTDGTDGADGTDGGPGTDSELAIDGVPFIVAGAGTEGLHGAFGARGLGGQSNGTVGTDGADGAAGINGVNGTTTPAQLPSGWTTVQSSSFQAPFASFASPFTAPLFTALTPQRLLDTRDTTVVVGGAAAREVDTAGVAGVPADAAAVVLNVTATGSTEPGFLTVYPCGTDLPDTSTVNFAAGQTIANSATVSLENGKVCVYSKVDVNVILDVNGAYSEADGTDLLVPVTPARLLDTRENGGAKIPASTVKEIAVAGESGVPADASAVVLNVTVTEPDNDGFVTLFPCGADVPLASNVNYVAGQTVPNQVTVKVGVDGKVCVTGNAGTHLVVDVDAAMSPNGSAYFQAQTPARLVDTRETPPRLSAGVVYELTVDDGQAGATAAALNVTVTNPAGDGFVTVFPCDADVPTVSNLNFTAGQTVANAVTTGLAASKACVLSTVDTDLVVDLSALFVGLN